MEIFGVLAATLWAITTNEVVTPTVARMGAVHSIQFAHNTDKTAITDSVITSNLLDLNSNEMVERQQKKRDEVDVVMRGSSPKESLADMEFKPNV